VRFDARQWIEFYPAAARLLFFAELMRQGAPLHGSGEASRVRHALEQAAPHERLPLLERHVIEQVASVLRLDAKQSSRSAPFQSLGMDSLMSLELRNRLETSLGVRLSATILFTYPHPSALAGYLLTVLDPSKSPARKEAPRSSSQATDDRGGLKAMEPMTERETVSAIDAEIDALEDYLR
jgi:acyl carrier protein